jgi:hypothetical protein
LASRAAPSLLLLEQRQWDNVHRPNRSSSQISCMRASLAASRPISCRRGVCPHPCVRFHPDDPTRVHPTKGLTTCSNHPVGRSLFLGKHRHLPCFLPHSQRHRRLPSPTAFSLLEQVMEHPVPRRSLWVRPIELSTSGKCRHHSPIFPFSTPPVSAHSGQSPSS